MKKIITIGLITLLFNSCIDVIELKVRDSKPHIVLEAILDATDSTCIVKATYSNGLYDASPNKKVAAENIILTNKTTNQNYYFAMNEDSTYIATKIIAHHGDIFELKFTDKKERKTYTARAQTPEKAPLFLVIFKKIPNRYNDKNQAVHFGLSYWLDTSAAKTYYKFEIFAKDTLYADNFMFVSDDFAINDTMQFGLRAAFFEGDTLTFQLQTVNQETYKYFWQLQDILRSGFGGAAPYNPVSNFDNYALGYFCIRQHKNLRYKVDEQMPIVF